MRRKFLSLLLLVSFSFILLGPVMVQGGNYGSDSGTEDTKTKYYTELFELLLKFIVDLGKGGGWLVPPVKPPQTKAEEASFDRTCKSKCESAGNTADNVFPPGPFPLPPVFVDVQRILDLIIKIATESIHLQVDFGRMVNEETMSDGYFLMQEGRATATVFTPQGLRYVTLFNSSIKLEKTSDLPVGVAREVTIIRPEGFDVTYRFATSASKGYPTASQTDFSSYLEMTDANGSPVTENPVYYVRAFGNGQKASFSASTKKLVSVIAGNGRVLSPSDPGIGIEIINDENDIIRQVRSAADGLADIVILDEYSYEIRLYASENAGTKNSGTGLFEPSGNPHTVWKIENPLRSDSNIDNVKFTETSNGNSYVYDWHYNSALDQWNLSEGNGLRSSSKSIQIDSTGTNKIVTYEKRDSSGSIVSKRVENVHLYPWGSEINEITLDPDGANEKITNSYYELNGQTGKYSRLKSVQRTDGSWEFYDYDTLGRNILFSKSYMDAAFNTSAMSTTYSYVSLDSADVPLENDTRPRSSEVKINGITVEKTYGVYKIVGGEEVIIAEKGMSTYGDSGNQRTVYTAYAINADPASAGRLKSVVHHDGRKDSYSYEYGTYSSNPNPESSSFTGGTGDALRKTIIHGTTASPAGVSGKSTKEVTVLDGRGNEVLSETYAYNGAGYSRISWTVRTYDSTHHVTASYNSNGTHSTATWSCCNKQNETLEDGTEYVYSYDLLKRMVSKTRKGAGSQPDIVTTLTRDSEGNILTRTVTGGSISTSESYQYDSLGKLTSATDAAGLTTTYSYSAGGRMTTRVLPGGFTEITEQYPDGKIKSITGTAVIAKYYDYGVNNDGTQWTKVCNVASNGPNYVKTTTDVFGRTVSEERPGHTGTLATGYFYNTQGLLTKTTSTGNADTLFSYDDFNNRTKTCLDLNANGSIDTAAVDRVTESDSSYVSESSNYYVVTTNKVYNDSGSAVTTGITKKQLTGLPTGTISKTISIDINSNETVSTTTLDRSAKTIVQTVNVPDSNVDSVSTTINGLLSTQSTSSNLTYSYSYDGLGRQISQTDPRTGNSVTHYNAKGQIDYIENAAANRTSFVYDNATGWKTEEINALEKNKLFSYNSRGQITSVRGNSDYPLDFVYDSYGRRTQLKTYRDSGLENSDLTTLNYQESTGLLLSKTDANNKSVSYTYSADGKLSTRTWARGAVTTYSYNLAGDLTGIDYSDTTPDIAFTYNRLGQQLTVTDAVGSRTFGYNGQFQLTSEAITGIYNKTLSRGYDSLGRSSSFSLQADNYSVAYGYDALGRFSSVTSGSDTFTYGYLANSNLISGISYPNNISVTKSYESKRDLITSIENKFDTTTISKYDYVNDALGRRSSMGKSGTAFTQTDSIAYGYNDKSEVTSAVATNQTTFNYGFNFDEVGNRITSASTETGTSVTRNYTSNNLNQYTAINNPTAAPTYDDDGNTVLCPLSSGDWSLTWDAENRLIVAEKSGQRLEFKYDYMSRRVEKRVIDGQSETSKERFVYNGYLQIEKLNALDSNAIEKKRIWGAEGKIIADINSSGTPFYALGDENKNITEYIDASGVIQGHYEFSPFGKITVASGNNPDVFDFRFSSEYFDTETGLVYFNFRYYSPEIGRWLSRDPIEEAGGWNLMAMVYNNPINEWDYLGLQDASELFASYSEALDTIRARCNRISDSCERDCCLKNAGEIAMALARGNLRSDADLSTTGFLAGLSDGSAGVADALTTVPFTDLSATEAIRNTAGINNIYDESSYGTGKIAGTVAQEAIIAAATAGQYKVPGEAYHFTSAESATKIASEGFKAGKGLFGEGVYVTKYNSKLLAKLQGAKSLETAVKVTTAGKNIKRTLIPGAFRWIP